MRWDHGAGAESRDALSGSRHATSRAGTVSATARPLLPATSRLPPARPATRPTGEGNTGGGHDGQDARANTHDSSAERALGGAEDNRTRRMRVWSATMNQTTQHIHLIPQPDLTPTRAGPDVLAADVFSRLSGARTTVKRKDAMTEERKEPGGAAETGGRGGTEIPAGRGSSGGRGETESQEAESRETESPNTSGTPSTECEHNTASTECEHKPEHLVARITEEGRKRKQAACGERARRTILSAVKTPVISSWAKTNAMPSPISWRAITKHLAGSGQEQTEQMKGMPRCARSIPAVPSSASSSCRQSPSMSASTRVRSKVRSKGWAEQAARSKGAAEHAATVSTQSAHTHSTISSQRHRHVRRSSHGDSDLSEDGRGSAQAYLSGSNAGSIAFHSWHPSRVPCPLSRQASSQSFHGHRHPCVPCLPMCEHRVGPILKMHGATTLIDGNNAEKT